MSSKTEVLSFDEFLAERGHIRGYKHDYQTAYEYGEQSKQNDVEELQKKIDLALEKCYTGIRKQGGDYYLELVQSILKGE